MLAALKPCLIAERANALDASTLPPHLVMNLNQSADDTDHEPVNPLMSRLGLSVLNISGTISADRRFILETMEKMIALADKPLPMALVEFEDTLGAVQARLKAFPPKPFSNLFLATLNHVPQTFAIHEARRRAGLTAIAIERYRVDHPNELPNQLADLVPQYLKEIAEDPFDGKPLRFRTKAKGYVVYSVGADREDHSGRERSLTTSFGKYDETFCVDR